MGPLSIEQVLAAEARAIHDLRNPEIKAVVDRLDQLAAAAAKPDSKRAQKDSDERSGVEEERQVVRDRREFYRELGKLRSAALCLSGGGIRSATFGLGIIQALAQYRLDGEPAEKRITRDAYEANANECLLSRFHYLSTVSGGGYIGSWLSAWRQRNDFPTVWRNLSSRPDGPDVEAPEISWLRAYSNYLTPKVGLFSADTWTGIAIYIRNLLLNWLVIIPAVAVVLAVLKMIVTGSVWLAGIDQVWWPHALSLLAGIACLILAQRFATHYRPTRRPPPPPLPKPPAERVDPNNIDQTRYLLNGLIWSLLSALLVTSTLTSAVGVRLAGDASSGGALILGAVAGMIIYALGWIAGLPENNRLKDFLRWSASGSVYGGLVGLGAYLFTLMMPYADICPRSIWNLLIPIVFGVPWVLFSQLAADMIFVGLVSYEANSDSDREWLGRAAGWQAATAVIWILATFITFAGGYFLLDDVYGKHIAPYLVSAGGISGALTAWLGKKGSGDAKPKLEKQPASAIAKKFGMALAGPVFAALLVVGISVVLDKLLLGRSLLLGLTEKTWTTSYILIWLSIGLAVAFVIAWIASRNVNINRFSIHALYRNRLVRGYLGASRPDRYPDRFTGFDEDDNPDIHELWPPKAIEPSKKNTYCLFHVVNITLNIVEATRLAWQQRKAESFTVTPLHSGTFHKGYRPSIEYASPRGGISLGTAMAISGAAASPNMGYNSSTSVTLLLALFNVRLGWWLGNPGKEGESTYQEEGPSTAIRPLVEETFGLTTDTKPWVYLSDGGHFENLGIYEMVRRRNRFILVVDGGCDPDYKFEDLGNAIRKIYIDLGVRIFIKDLDQLRNRPTADVLAVAIKALGEAEEKDKPPIPYFAVGTIGYREADGDECEDGVLLYVKPAYHGVSSVEDAGVRSYANESQSFPHEPTGDQWFTESQFESYRSLAFDIARTFMKGQKIIPPSEREVATAKEQGSKAPGSRSLGSLLGSLAPTVR
ncbi:MAG: patatin-like phospholipase family protein [Pseudolabrys sp.]|nr:patatin-like phospholipase family protein [Pseudolabrys sp.]